MIDDILINVYQTTTNGEMFLLENSASVIYKNDSADSCNFSYEIPNLDGGITTVESIISNSSNSKQIVQRVTDALELDQKTILETMTKDSSEISDRVIPVMLEKYTDLAEKERLLKLDYSNLRIYIDIIKDTVKESIGTLKQNSNFNHYNPGTLRPIKDEFYDKNLKRISIDRYKNSEFTRNDYVSISQACETDESSKNYLETIILEESIDLHSNSIDLASDILDDIFGDEIMNRYSVGLNLVKFAISEKKYFPLNKVAKALFVSIDFNRAKNEGGYIQSIPSNEFEILQGLKYEITDNQGMIKKMFNYYENSNISAREKYRNNRYKPDSNREGVIKTKGMRSVFSKKHRWKNNTTLTNNEPISILELWILMTLKFDTEDFPYEYMDIAMFFDILNN